MRLVVPRSSNLLQLAALVLGVSGALMLGLVVGLPYFELPAHLTFLVLLTAALSLHVSACFHEECLKRPEGTLVWLPGHATMRYATLSLHLIATAVVVRLMFVSGAPLPVLLVASHWMWFGWLLCSLVRVPLSWAFPAPAGPGAGVLDPVQPM